MIRPAMSRWPWLSMGRECPYSDDTRVKILSCLKENKDLEEEERRGTQTSGMVIEVGGRKIAIYANSRRHAGENLDELLKARSKEGETILECRPKRKGVKRKRI